jgi:hypothetical protein
MISCLRKGSDKYKVKVKNYGVKSSFPQERQEETSCCVPHTSLLVFIRVLRKRSGASIGLNATCPPLAFHNPSNNNAFINKDADVNRI